MSPAAITFIIAWFKPFDIKKKYSFYSWAFFYGSIGHRLCWFNNAVIGHMQIPISLIQIYGII